MVFVVDCRFERPLNVSVNIIGPLATGDGPDSAARSDLLLDQYVSVLHRTWAESPWMVDLGKMTQHLANPIDEKNATLPEAV